MRRAMYNGHFCSCVYEVLDTLGMEEFSSKQAISECRRYTGLESTW